MALATLHVHRATSLCHRRMSPISVSQPIRRTVHAAASASGAASGTVLVVGGGFAGLSAAQVLTAGGYDVHLVEQGRGLGGKVCTRSVQLPSGERLTFDHGCQYLTPRTPQFDSALERLAAQGAIEPWAAGGSVGTISTREGDGTFDETTFVPDNKKTLWVGLPTNSAVGRALAAMAGPRLAAHTGTRVEQLLWEAGRRRWRARIGKAAGGPEAAAKLEATSFDAVVTALGSHSTVRLLDATTSTAAAGAGGDGDGDGGAEAIRAAAAGVRAAAADVQANVCWSLMLALRKKTGLPFDGAMVTGPSAGSGSPLAWVARDSSKPGRPQVAGGQGEAWVVQAAPGWSNARRDVDPREVARELTQEFAKAAWVPISDSDVLYSEAFRWNNAYPLNPRPAQPQPPYTGLAAPVAPGDSVSAPSVALGGHFMVVPELRLVACGDWCKGPRVGDTYVTGWEAGHVVLNM